MPAWLIVLIGAVVVLILAGIYAASADVRRYLRIRRM